MSRHAPQRVVVANQVVGPVPEDDLAEVTHDFEVLPLVVGTTRGQGHQAAALSKRVDHIAAQEACAAEDADTQAADGVSAAWTACSDARLHCQRSRCSHRCCVCPSLTALRRRADGATCGARATRCCPVHGAELFARGAMLTCGAHVITDEGITAAGPAAVTASIDEQVFDDHGSDYLLYFATFAAFTSSGLMQTNL